MLRHLSLVLLLVASANLFAQQADAPTRKRSLADGLVRQRIEVDRLSPPQLRHGVELGTGDGPMVLLVRSRDGTLTATELQRGPGSRRPVGNRTGCNWRSKSASASPCRKC